MNNYAFKTKDNSRVEVIASTPKSAYNKLMSLPMFKDKVTKSYWKYSKSGIVAVYDIRHYRG